MSTMLASDRFRVEQVVREHGAAIRRYFARRISDRTEAEDLTQEVFARLLRRAQLGDIDNVAGYVFQIAANLLTERIRNTARRPLSYVDMDSLNGAEPREERDPERIYLGREAQLRLVRALQRLPERVRVTFVLNRFEDLSGTEIAERLGVSTSTVEKDMMRAIAYLKAHLP